MKLTEEQLKEIDKAVQEKTDITLIKRTDKISTYKNKFVKLDDMLLRLENRLIVWKELGWERSSVFTELENTVKELRRHFKYEIDFSKGNVMEIKLPYLFK